MMKVATELIREDQGWLKTASCLFTPSPVFITWAFFSSEFAYRSKNKKIKKRLNKEVSFSCRKENDSIQCVVQSVCTF